MKCLARVLCFAKVFLFAAISAMGQPVVQAVQGTFANGGTVTVVGSAIGSKPNAAPVLWDTFENGTVGNSIDDRAAVIGDWDSDSLPWGPQYSDAIVHSGSQSSYHRFKDGQYNVSLSKNLVFQRLYMDFWMYVDYADSKSRNWKIWRFFGDADNNQLTYVYLCNATFIATLEKACSPKLEKNYWEGAHYSNKQWLHVQLEYQESGINVASGSVRHFVNSVSAGVNSDAVMTRTCDHSLSQIRIGHYWGFETVGECTANSGADVYVDNVYIDTSWARVEIGNNPTYDASTHREIQFPTAWSDTSVSIEVNRGSFSPGETVYLYVVDASGRVNVSGLPVVISAGSGIASPTRLRVVK